jgi:malate synthase
MTVPAGVEVLHPTAGVPAASARVLTAEALAFVADLERRFGERRRALLAARGERQRRLDAGEMPTFLPETASVRAGSWRVAPTPSALERRRVEITGPGRAEDDDQRAQLGRGLLHGGPGGCHEPDLGNVVEGAGEPDGRGTAHARARRRRQGVPARRPHRPPCWCAHAAGTSRKPTCWSTGAPCRRRSSTSGSTSSTTHARRWRAGRGPYFYLPKLEAHPEARLWNDVFTLAQQRLGIPHGSVRATVLIETVLAAFEMDEILYELRDHAAGLNAGRWDYIFSIIKKFSRRADMLLPDRAQVSMAVPFMRAYSELLVQTCHRRGAHAMGGMAAFVPNRRDAAVTRPPSRGCGRTSCARSATASMAPGFAHPDLVPIAMQVFVRAPRRRPNQKDRPARRRPGRRPSSAGARRTRRPHHRAGRSHNVDVALQYVDAWLRGSGAVAIHNLMEDAATAEISRAQLWQWIRHGRPPAEGTRITREHYLGVRAEELAALERARAGDEHRLPEAAELLDRLVLQEAFDEFLTLGAYRLLDPTLHVAPRDEERPHGDPLRRMVQR